MPNLPTPSESTPQLVIDTGGHKAMIRDVIFTPDGRQLISVSNDKTIRIWDTGSGELVRTLRGQTGAGHEGKLYAGALSPDGRWLAVGGLLAGSSREQKTAIRLIDLEAPPDAPLQLLKGHGNAIASLAFSPDGKRLLSGSGVSDLSARLWDVESGKTLKVLSGHTGEIYAVAFSPDGERLVTGSYDKTLRLWDKDGNPIKVLAGHTDKVRAAAFTPDGKYLLSGSDDQTIRLWDAGTGAFIQQLAEQDSRVSSLAISPDGKKMLTGHSRTIAERVNHVFAIPSGKRLLRFTEHKNIVLATAISPDAQKPTLAATGGGSAMEIYLWDLATGEIRHKLVGKGNPIWSVGFARDGGSLAWGKEQNIPDWSKMLFNKGPLQHHFQLRRAAGWTGSNAPESSAPGASPQQHATPQDGNGMDTDFDPTWGGRITDESYLRAIEQVGVIRIRTADGQIHPTLEILEDGQVVHTITRGPTDGNDHRSLTLTPDGRTVVSGGMNGFLTSFDVATGKKRQDFIGHTGDVLAVAPSPDGRFLVSGSADQTVRLWELATGKALLTIFPAADGEWVAWTPEGYYTASLNGDRLIGWHINQGENKLARYYPAERFAGRFRKPRVVANYLATGGDIDEAIRLANLELPPREQVTRTDMADIPDIAPPEVFIGEPFDQRITTDKAHLTLKAEARSVNEEPVTEIWITVNGRLPDKDGVKRFKNTRQARFETSLSLDPGENRIAVCARNRHTSSGPQLLEVTRQDPEPEPLKSNLYVLAIGVSRYKHTEKVRDLDYPHWDAEGVADMLRAQEGRLYGRVAYRLCTNDKADRDGILDGLDWLVRESTQHDVSVIFLAGHGTSQRDNYYFLSHDADPDHLPRTGILWFYLQDTLKQLPGTRWLLIDTCHAGMIAGKRDAAQEDADITEALRALQKAAGHVAVMAAAGDQEESREHSDWKHGAFTRALIDGVEGKHADHDKDGHIGIRELDRYITERVKELTEGRQHTITDIPEDMPNFPVAMVD
uniref:WD40 repeat n=1 Tax=Candidatus Kentrum sp. FW TaxID=2126338 RepID=A0A450T709_9GAMM|nr:MAG: WD40 repeat [Candidatus Kentron sp. FW]